MELSPKLMPFNDLTPLPKHIYVLKKKVQVSMKPYISYRTEKAKAFLHHPKISQKIFTE